MPDDDVAVLRALRLGWYVAEVRGRNRPDAPQPETATRPQRMDHALPLRSERGAEELRIESQAVLSQLSKDCKVNSDKVHADYGTEIGDLAHNLDTARKNPAANPTAEDLWKTFTDTLFHYDAHVQDTLSSTSDKQATAYLLGRGLAETYWALDSAAGDGTVKSWNFLLGDERISELSRGVGRLSAYFSSYTAAAISGSLAAWKKVAADGTWRSQSGSRERLYLQIRRWYELVVLGQDPSTLIKPYAILKSWRTALQALRTFAVQLITLGVSLALLIGLTFLATYGKTSATANAFIGILSALGITTAAVQANLKNSAQAAMSRLRQDAYTDLVAGDITVLPSIPGKSPEAMRKETIRASQARSITTEAAA